MIAILLIKKILSLFLLIGTGFLLVKARLLSEKDSRVLSALCLYVSMPCMILTAFQAELTGELVRGLMLAVLASVLVNLGLVALVTPLAGLLRMNGVEAASVIYSNAGNLVVPLVTTLLGKEWVIYSNVFLAVQMVFLWSHGKIIICGEKKPDWKRILKNINMIAILAGVVCLALQIRFPFPVRDAMESAGSMIGPLAMLVTGMLMGGMNWNQILGHRRVWGIAALRLAVFPLLATLFLKYSGLAAMAEEGEKILLIVLIAVITPAASTITQMAQMNGKDAEYAGIISVVTTVLCIVTMPVMVALYQWKH